MGPGHLLQGIGVAHISKCRFVLGSQSIGELFSGLDRGRSCASCTPRGVVSQLFSKYELFSKYRGGGPHDDKSSNTETRCRFPREGSFPGSGRQMDSNGVCNQSVFLVARLTTALWAGEAARPEDSLELGWSTGRYAGLGDWADPCPCH